MEFTKTLIDNGTAHTTIQVKTLHQMFGPNGNPTASNLFEVVAYLQRAEGVRFKVRCAPLDALSGDRGSYLALDIAVGLNSRKQNCDDYRSPLALDARAKETLTGGILPGNSAQFTDACIRPLHSGRCQNSCLLISSK